MVPTLFGRVRLYYVNFTKEALRLKPKSKLHRFDTLDGPRGCMCMPRARPTFHWRYDNARPRSRGLIKDSRRARQQPLHEENARMMHVKHAVLSTF